MKTVYNLRDQHDYIAKVQAASLSPKPFGIKPTHGLFGSEEWWRKVESGVIPVTRYTGTITRLFRAGMRNESECFEMVTDDGQSFQYDCIATQGRDRNLYRVGAKVELSFVSEELKQPVRNTTGDIRDTHSRTLVEVKVEGG